MQKRQRLPFLKVLLAALLSAGNIALWPTSKAVAAGVVISGQVRNDLNSNGNINESDPGISGVAVALYQDDGTGKPTGGTIGTAITDSSGSYSFTGISPGSYVIVEVNPLNYVSSGDSQGANDDKIVVSVGSFDKSSNIFLDVNTASLDYGDAPDTYGTKLNGATLPTAGGARHARDGKLFLGAGVTGEADGQPSSAATADANDDGVTFSPSLGPNYSTLIQAGISNTVDVVSSGAGYLNAWIDYNENGVFDSGEQVFTNQPVSTGKNTLTLPTPPDTLLHGPTAARFRLSPNSITSPSSLGLVSGGEVEDYQVNVADPVPNGLACSTTGLLNGGFEQPSGVSTYIQTAETNVPGWNTTSSDGLIEIWKSGFNSVPSYAGNQFAEVNATQNAALFQDIATVPGSTLTWRFAHRARVKNTSITIDEIEVKIGAPGATVRYGDFSTDSTGWVIYQGTYVVPAGQYITRLEFNAIKSGSGDSTYGNFIEGVEFSTSTCVTPIFPPAIDLDGNDSSGAQGNNYRNLFAGGNVAVSAADTDVSITDDKTNIASAKIRLTNFPDTTNESLSIDTTAGGTVPTGTITASTYNSSTGQLTLSGTTTLANYAKVIATLKYKNALSTPTSSDRIISVQVADSDGLSSNLAFSTLALTFPPTLDLDGNDSSGAPGSSYKNTFKSGAGAVSAADTDVAITDDKANIKSATITLTNRPNTTAEILSIDPTAGGTIPTGTITASTYNSSTGQLTLSGTTTLTNYQKVLDTLKYNNTASSPDLTARIINVSVVDTDSLSSNTAVTTISMAAPLPPTLDLDGNNSSGAIGNDYKNVFKPGAGAVSAADTDVAITDEGANIKSATITLTNRLDGSAESLSFDAATVSTVTGITPTAYDPATGKLTLNGNATLADYQKIIATLTYNNTKASPNNTTRLISAQLVDADDNLSSNTALSAISIIIPPTLDLDGNDSSGATGNNYINTFKAGAGPVSAADSDVVIAADSANIMSATITLTNPLDGSAEGMSIDVTAGNTVTGITATAYNSATGKLTLSGSTTFSNYQKVIATLKYNNTKTTPDSRPRIIKIVVTDSYSQDSNEAISTIDTHPSSLLLVKRITAINGGTTSINGDDLSKYYQDDSYPYDDNLIETGLAPNVSAGFPTPDTDKWPNTIKKDSSTFLIGGIKGGDAKPNDEVEYTIYFLSTGTTSAQNVTICDRIPAHQTFTPKAYNALTQATGGNLTDRGIAVSYAGNYQGYTNLTDGDTAQYYAPGSTLPGACGAAVNTTGAVVVNLGTGATNALGGTVRNATAPGTPTDSYGFVRFKAKVN
jgi:uncharacterized repeat protein (TIGR01451 family)